MSRLLSTDAVEPRHRLAYWTEMICGVYVPLACEPGASSQFRGSIRESQLPGLEISVVNSSPQHVRRTSSLISRSTEDCFLVSIQTGGRGVVRQDGRDAVLQPGDFALYDSNRQYELMFDSDFEQIVFKLPGESLRNALSDTQSVTASPVRGDTGAGQLLGKMLGALREGMSTMPTTSAALIADSFKSIVVAGLRSLPGAKGAQSSPLTNGHLARIKSFIAMSLGDPELSISSISAQLGLSVGHVHRLFNGEPVSLTQYIWNQRLEACSRDLLDPRQDARSVAEIGYQRGFKDAAHFSRSFRERFGTSPRAWRASNRVGAEAGEDHAVSGTAIG
jgi:AraC-like DNA-binding protein